MSFLRREKKGLYFIFEKGLAARLRLLSLVATLEIFIFYLKQAESE